MIAVTVCEPYASMYDPADIEPWAGFDDDFHDKPYAQKQLRVNWDVQDMTWDDWAPFVARYLGVITQLDDQVGRVMKALDERGLADDTLVVYTSDHGDLCGSHGLPDKHFVMYDDVVRVPMMMRWPGRIAPAQQLDQFISNAIDLGPTFCGAAALECPDTFAGRNILDIAAGSADWPRDDIFASYHGNQFGSFSQRMLRDRRFKYVWNATDVDELYDLEKDPGELENIVADPQAAKILSRLRRRLAQWMREINDPLLNGFTLRQLEEGKKI